MTKKYNIKFQDKEYKRITGPVGRRENGKSLGPVGYIYTYSQAVKSLKILRARNNNYNYTMEETA